ncbi:MAG: ATP-binding protein, partial [bacterium]|nr:ATP-binding protein [bacterium]
DYFISVREVRIGHLDPATARDLVRRPIPEFPADAVPEAVAERIVERTGAQPFLVQLYAQLLVETLNAQERTQATLDDLEAIELEVLEQATYYFRNTWQRAPDPARSDLAALARGTTPGLERESRRWLGRRCLIDDQGRLTIPVLGRFLIEEELV